MDASVVRNDIGMSTLPRDFESLPFIKEHLRHQYRSILIEQMVHLWTLDGNRFLHRQGIGGDIRLVRITGVQSGGLIADAEVHIVIVGKQTVPLW